MGKGRYAGECVPGEISVQVRASWRTNPAARKAAVVSVLIAVAMSFNVFILAACSGGGEQPEEERSTAAGAEGFNLWSKECYTEKYNPTVRAISGLVGWQLEELMLQLGYTWDKATNEWRVGDCRVFVSDADAVNLSAERVHSLDRGALEPSVVYTIVTTEFATKESAYAALVSDVMTSEDTGYDRDRFFGVAQTRNGERILVAVSSPEAGSEVRLQAFSEAAVANGLFDRFSDVWETAAEDTYGSSIDEVFQALVGWLPGQLDSDDGSGGSSDASARVGNPGPVDDCIYVVSRNGESQTVGFHEEAAAQKETIRYRGHEYELEGTVSFYDDEQEIREYANKFSSRLSHGEILLVKSQGGGMTVFNRYKKIMAQSRETGE